MSGQKSYNLSDQNRTASTSTRHPPRPFSKPEEKLHSILAKTSQCNRILDRQTSNFYILIIGTSVFNQFTYDTILIDLSHRNFSTRRTFATSAHRS